jgi:hypothetical protein
MKKLPQLFGAIAVSLVSATVLADNVGGSAKADFKNNQLTIPCVKVTNLSTATEGKYFDVILVRRGNSFNYEMTTAEPEDAALCEKIANLAEFEDDDLSPSNSGSVNTTSAMLLQCEVRSNRSKISVKGKNLASGQYYATVSSGTKNAQSANAAAVGDEAEFDFDSDAGDIAEGATAISTDFIQGAKVSAKLFKVGTTTALASMDSSCLVKK